MKKSITIVLAFAMVLCLAATAFAATPGSDSTAQAPQMPANIQMNGEAPTDGLLAELLDAGVITQAEYEAIIAQNTK